MPQSTSAHSCRAPSNSGPSPFPQWLRDMLGQVLDALEYLHRLDIIHR